MGRPASGKWRAEPRSEPDSGHPTVRDRRGALGDVTHGEPRNPTRKSKERLWSLLAYRCARPGSIPTTRTSGSVGGQGQQRPWSTRPLLDSNAVHADAVAGVSNAWRRRGNSLALAGRQTPTERDADHLPAGQVPISCGGKAHATIWGRTVRRIEDIPSADARSVFRNIASVQGITRITLGQFGHKGSRSGCQARVGVSRSNSSGGEALREE